MGRAEPRRTPLSYRNGSRVRRRAEDRPVPAVGRRSGAADAARITSSRSGSSTSAGEGRTEMRQSSWPWNGCTRRNGKRLEREISLIILAVHDAQLAVRLAIERD